MGPFLALAIAAWGQAIQRRSQQGLPTPEWCLYDFGFAALLRVVLIPLQLIFLWGALAEWPWHFTLGGVAAHLGLGLFNFPGPTLTLLGRYGPPRLAVFVTRLLVPWRARSCPREVGVLSVLESGRAIDARLLDSLERELDRARNPTPLRVYAWARLAALRGRQADALALLHLSARLPALLDTVEARARARGDLQAQAEAIGDRWAVARWGTEPGIRKSPPDPASRARADRADRPVPAREPSASPPDHAPGAALPHALRCHRDLLRPRAVDPAALAAAAQAWDVALTEPHLEGMRRDVIDDLAACTRALGGRLPLEAAGEVLREARRRAVAATHEAVDNALASLRDQQMAPMGLGRRELWTAAARLVAEGDRLCQIGDRTDQRLLHDQTYRPLISVANTAFNVGKQRLLGHVLMAWQYDLALRVADPRAVELLAKNLLVTI